jgi:hypothetical protein
MVASPTPKAVAQQVAYKSPKHAQVWFLQRSRNLWKAKHHALKVESKHLLNRVADVTKSRDRWRTRAEDAQRRLAELQRQHDDLLALVQATPAKKGDS